MNTGNQAGHSVRDTSIEANNKLVSSGKTQRNKDKLFNALKRIQPATRRMISKISGIEFGTSPSPIGELIKEGKIKESHKDKCKDSGYSAWYLIIKD